MKSDAYAYRDRRNRKRDFRVAVDRAHQRRRAARGPHLQPPDGRPARGRGRGQPQDARGRRRARPGDLPAICRASQAGPGGVRGRILTISGRRQTPRAATSGQPPFFVSDPHDRTDHKHTQPPPEGAAEAARAQAPRAHGPVHGRGGGHARRGAGTRPRARDAVLRCRPAAALRAAARAWSRSRSTARRWPRAERARQRVARDRRVAPTAAGPTLDGADRPSTCTTSPIPGNVGTVLRAAQAFGAGLVVLSPRTADPFGPKAVRASMGAIFGQPVARATWDQARAARDLRGGAGAGRRHAAARARARRPAAVRARRRARRPAGRDRRRLRRDRARPGRAPTR